jgi:hypothetical protein
MGWFVQALGPAGFQPTRANEIQDALQFIAVKPGAVPFAHIDHDVRAVCEVDAVHQTLTDRARNIANLLEGVGRRFK